MLLLALKMGATCQRNDGLSLTTKATGIGAKLLSQPAECHQVTSINAMSRRVVQPNLAPIPQHKAVRSEKLAVVLSYSTLRVDCDTQLTPEIRVGLTLFKFHLGFRNKNR